MPRAPPAGCWRWQRGALERLRRPETAAEFDPNEHLAARLRPYQEQGVKWLWLLQSLGLGACLADDMGLGKTVQVIALLLRLKHEESAAARPPALLVVPASLLANWKGELARFAPGLRAGFLHPSETPAGGWRDAAAAERWLAGKDVVLTTYGQAARLEWLVARPWRLLVLDEAQAIKSPGARQTRAVKRLRAPACGRRRRDRRAATGAPHGEGGGQARGGPLREATRTPADQAGRGRQAPPAPSGGASEAEAARQARALPLTVGFPRCTGARRGWPPCCPWDGCEWGNVLARYSPRSLKPG